jgi:hypothetical protein
MAVAEVVRRVQQRTLMMVLGVPARPNAKGTKTKAAELRWKADELEQALGQAPRSIGRAVPALVAIALALFGLASCGGSHLSGSSTCGDYMSAPQSERQSVVNELATQYDAPDYATPVGFPEVAYDCASDSDQTLDALFQRYSAGGDGLDNSAVADDEAGTGDDATTRETEAPGMNDQQILDECEALVGDGLLSGVPLSVGRLPFMNNDNVYVYTPQNIRVCKVDDSGRLVWVFGKE